MKKLLVMLLAAGMVLTTSFALTSCGGDDTTDESSKPAEESKVVSTEDSVAASEDAASEESSVAEPSEVVSAEDSTSDDATSDDTTSDDATSDDASAPAGDITYVTTPTKTNYALGKTYTLTRDSADTDPNYLYLSYDSGDTKWSDVELKKMTDGNVGDITNEAYGSSAAALDNVSVQLVGTNKLFEYVIDLGEYYGDINSFVFRNVRHGTPNGNNRGFKLRLAYVSDDSVNWTKVNGTLTPAAIPGAPELKSNKEEGVVNVEHFNYTYTLNEAAKGKYVRICLVSDGGYVIQLEEIEIWN